MRPIVVVMGYGLGMLSESSPAVRDCRFLLGEKEEGERAVDYREDTVCYGCPSRLSFLEEVRCLLGEATQVVVISEETPEDLIEGLAFGLSGTGVMLALARRRNGEWRIATAKRSLRRNADFIPPQETWH